MYIYVQYVSSMNVLSWCCAGDATIEEWPTVRRPRTSYLLAAAWSDSCLSIFCFPFFLSFLVPLYVHISDYISCNILLINLKAVMIGTLAMKAIFT